MNDPLAELDPALAARFRNEHTHVADEPFVAATLQRVAAERARAAITRRVLQAAALIAVIAASPWLIPGSVLVSNVLDQGFARASAWLATPAGIALGVVVAALIVVYRARAARAGR
jgi:hypothetical protein